MYVALFNAVNFFRTSIKVKAENVPGFGVNILIGNILCVDSWGVYADCYCNCVNSRAIRIVNHKTFEYDYYFFVTSIFFHIIYFFS